MLKRPLGDHPDRPGQSGRRLPLFPTKDRYFTKHPLHDHHQPQQSAHAAGGSGPVQGLSRPVPVPGPVPHRVRGGHWVIRHGPVQDDKGARP
ncbi:MAG: hypothetical protein MZV64_60575 [Ignavibacteriales bacterium]|nr:hypothetical protein [Ignavibacteriales bacterium]